MAVLLASWEPHKGLGQDIIPKGCTAQVSEVDDGQQLAHKRGHVSLRSYTIGRTPD